MIRASGDFGDGRGRGRNQTRWSNFCNAAWGCIRNYVNGEIQLIGSKASREIIANLRNRGEQFRNEIGNQMSSLTDVQGELVIWVRNMAQSVDYKLTGNGGRNGKQEHVSDAMYAEILKLIQAVGGTEKNRQMAQLQWAKS